MECQLDGELVLTQLGAVSPGNRGLVPEH